MFVTDEAFLAAAEASNRRVKTYISLCSIGAPDFMLPERALIKLTINQRVEANQNTLKIGSACSSYIQLNLRNDVIKTEEGDTLTFKEWFANYPGRKKYIEIWGVYLDENGKFAGNTEAHIGKFYITEAVTSNDQKTVNIVAYDKMSQLRGTYTTSLTFPTTTWNGVEGCTTTLKMMIYELCQRLGIVMKNFDSLPDVAMAKAPSGKYTDQEMIGFMAGCYGCNARFDADENLEFVWYDETPVTISRKLQHMGGFKRTCDDDLKVDLVVIGDTEVKNDVVDPADVPWLAFTYEEGEVTLSSGEVLSGNLATVSLNSEYTGEIPSKMSIPANVKYEGGVSPVVAIAESGFESSSITEIVLSKNIIDIGASAFNKCASLSEVTIPENVTSMGEYAFFECSGLKTIYWNAVNCTSVGLTSKAPFENTSALSRIVIADNVQTIPERAFSDAGSSSTILSVDIPDSVTTIGSMAFCRCGMEQITIPKNVATIGTYAFSGCSNLKTVYWNAVNCSYTSIGSRAPFVSSDNISSIVFADNVQVIPNYLFYSESSPSTILSVDIPNSVTTIGSGAFVRRGMEHITIPENVTTIGAIAFSNCRNLKTVYFNAINCTACGTATGNNFAFKECSLQNIIIGPYVTKIPNYAFYAYSYYGYESEVLNLYIPGNVVSVGTKAFANHTAMEHVFVGESGYNYLNTLSSDAFYGCAAVKEIYIYATEGSIANSPWGAENAAINWLG